MLKANDMPKKYSSDYLALRVTKQKMPRGIVKQKGSPSMAESWGAKEKDVGFQLYPRKEGDKVQPYRRQVCPTLYRIRKRKSGANDRPNTAGAPAGRLLY